jgi:predicted outer membrane protein
MNLSLALVLLFANAPQEAPAMPPSRDARSEPTPLQQGTPTDPLFDKQLIATDEPTFVRSAIEAARQGEVDARGAAESLRTPSLREAASRIARQNESTRTNLESLAKRKGWRVPEEIPARASGVPAAKSDARRSADFIVQQISFHEATVAQFRAQINGKSDAELQRALRGALPGYQRNLELLLQLKL